MEIQQFCSPPFTCFISSNKSASPYRIQFLLFHSPETEKKQKIKVCFKCLFSCAKKYHIFTDYTFLTLILVFHVTGLLYRACLLSLLRYMGAKYLVFVSSRSLKTRELSFAQFVHFLREVFIFQF